jgi:outer membrane immunogenic protein
MRALALILALVATPAAAADMPLKARPAPAFQEAYSWSGVYLDGYFQYGANVSNGTTTVGTGLGSVSIDLGSIPHGPGVGGGVDFLYQLSGSPLVIGARAQVGWMNLQSTGAVTMPVGSLSLSNATNYNGDFNGILGYAYDRLLLYITGGLAFGGEHPNLSAAGICLTSPTNSCAQAISDTAVGADIGVGLKYALSDHIGIFIEGNYSDIGSKALTIGGGTTGMPLTTSSIHSRVITQQGGLFFKF